MAFKSFENAWINYRSQDPAYTNLSILDSYVLLEKYIPDGYICRIYINYKDTIFMFKVFKKELMKVFSLQCNNYSKKENKIFSDYLSTII